MNTTPIEVPDACDVGRSPWLSLVMATVGRSDEPVVFVESLLLNEFADVELIIVDQNPDDRLSAAVEAATAGGLAVTWLRFGERNLSAARNAGVAIARGAVVGFPDDDCWYEPDVVAKVRTVLDGEPDIGVLVGMWVEQAGDATTDRYLLSGNDWRRFRGGHASSISLFWRKRILEELGCFDRRLGVGGWYGGGEETDVIMAGLARGVRMTYDPVVRVHHPFGVNPAQALPVSVVCRNARRRGRGTGALYAKHRLSAFVVVRGLVAPIVKSLLSFAPPTEVMKSACVCIGRLEGMVRWTLREK